MVDIVKFNNRETKNPHYLISLGRLKRQKKKYIVGCIKGDFEDKIDKTNVIDLPPGIHSLLRKRKQQIRKTVVFGDPP